MRRLALLLLLSSALVPVASAGGGGKPDNVAMWLGSWDTNFGTLYFNDVFRERAAFPDANGRRPYHWEIRGEWQREGRPNKRIDAVVLESDRYRTVSGCWLPPPEPASCGRIFVYRRGSEIKGGFWKDCQQNCKSHHPWRGEKKEGAWKLGFRFTQRGHPDGERNERTETGGAGSIVQQHEVSGEKEAEATRDSHMFQVARVKPEERLTVDFTRGSVVRRERRAHLYLVGFVSKSNVDSCKRGAGVTMTLTEGVGGVPDKIELRYHRSCEERSRTFTSSDPDRVSVHIGELRETK